MSRTQLSGHRVPLRIWNRALHILSLYRQRRLHPRKTRQHGYLTLRVDRRWRLVSRNDGQHWEVMSHERYNGEIRK